MTPQIKQRIEQIRRGEVPEGYKKTKVGIVPEEWEEKRISDVLTQRKTLICVSEDAPLLSFTIEEGVIDPADKKSNKRDFLIKDMATKKFALTEVGDIIYNPANLKFGAIHSNNLRRGVVSPIYGVFYGLQNSTFIGYLLHNQRFIDYAKVYTEGTVEKLKTLKPDIFLRLKIAFPPLPEQEKIAEILQTQDKVIELQQKKIDELKRLKKVYLSKMFPKKGCNVPEIRFPGFTDPWEQRKLGEVAQSFEYGLNAAAKEYDGINKYLRITDIDDASRKFNTDNLTSPDTGLETAENYRLVDGDILFARTGASVGKSYIYRAVDGLVYFAGFLIRARIKPEYDAEFIFQNTLSESYGKYIQVASQRSGQPGVNAQEYADYKLYLPTYDEQHKIGAFLRSLDNLITLHQRKCDEEKQKKKALMQLLLTGIVRVEVKQ